MLFLMRNALCNTLEDDDKCAIAAPIQLNSKGEIINDYAWPFPTIWQTISRQDIISNA